MKPDTTDRSASRTGVAPTKSVLGDAAATMAIPKKWEWHYHALDSLKNRLINKSSGLRNELTHPPAPSGEDIEEFSMDELEQDLALSELAAETDALNEVNAAIKRILHGTYGVCETSGEAIPADRLRAVPWTRYTREVKERIENET